MYEDHLVLFLISSRILFFSLVLEDSFDVKRLLQRTAWIIASLHFDEQQSGTLKTSLIVALIIFEKKKKR